MRDVQVDDPLRGIQALALEGHAQARQSSRQLASRVHSLAPFRDGKDLPGLGRSLVARLRSSLRGRDAPPNVGRAPDKELDNDDAKGE